MTKMTLEKINLLESVEECLRLAKNAEHRGRDDFAKAAYDRAAILRAKATLREGKRPAIDYYFIGLKNGDKLLLDDIGEEAEVYSHRTLLYKGIEIYITPLEAKLIEAGYPRKSVAARWVVKETGALLNDLYDKAYGPLDPDNQK